MALRRRVCAAAEIAPGEIKAFFVAGLDSPVLVANVGGRYVATASVCPHEDVSLVDGDVEGTRIVCPGHGYRFDLLTGRCAHDPTLRLSTYRVTVSHGNIYLDLVTL